MTNVGGDDARDRVALIYERYAPRIAAYALRRSTGSDAADTVAETFLVVWRRRDAVPDEPDTLPWLYGVARRVLANQRRSHRRRGRLSERLAAEFTQHSVVQHDVGATQLEDVEEFRRVANALKELSADDAELLRLMAWEALTPSEIATTMGIPPGTARQRISRARQRLRKQLAKDGFEVKNTGAPPPEVNRRRADDRSPVEPSRPQGTLFSPTVRGGLTS